MNQELSALVNNGTLIKMILLDHIARCADEGKLKDFNGNLKLYNKSSRNFLKKYEGRLLVVRHYNPINKAQLEMVEDVLKELSTAVKMGIKEPSASPFITQTSVWWKEVENVLLSSAREFDKVHQHNPALNGVHIMLGYHLTCCVCAGENLSITKYYDLLQGE